MLEVAVATVAAFLQGGDWLVKLLAIGVTV